MTKLVVDGIEVDVPPEYTLLQACEAAGAEIPRFCFHERLSIAGNCRMCLVELKGSPKPVASCAWAVRDCRPGPNGEPPVVNTRTELVKKAREGVMEFLLINHPLDCPICDQGGECDLQDQAMAYGVDSSRYWENKRAVEDKYIGVLVKTSMNRCIHCTRCVRFATEVAGVPELGAIGRGEDMEITTYLEQAMTSELQSNVVDLCPVGALTSKPYAFSARPWELNKTESIDVMDAVGSAIRIDTRGREVMRILPRINEDVNEEWISDKTRHVVDGLALAAARHALHSRERAVASGKLERGLRGRRAEGESGKAGPHRCHRRRPFRGRGHVRAEGIAEPARLEECRCAPARLDDRSALGSGGLSVQCVDSAESSRPTRCSSSAPIRARKPPSSMRASASAGAPGHFPIALIGDRVDLTYPYHYLGAGPDSLAELAEGKGDYADILYRAERPLVLVGASIFTRNDGARVAALAARVAVEIGAVSDVWNGYSVLHYAASRVGALDIGFVPGEGGKTALQMASGDVDVLFSLGADEIDVERGPFVVYIGTHGDAGAHRADVILPGAAYPEKSGIYVNTEGRVQMAARAAFPPGDAREEWAILRALSEHLGARLPYDSLSQLRQALFAAFPHLQRIGEIVPGDARRSAKARAIAGLARQGAFHSVIDDFYLTNPIARASAVMAECSALAEQRSTMTAAE